MVVSQPTTRINNSQELLDGRMAQDSQEAEKDLLEDLLQEEALSTNRVDWIEGTLVLSF